MPYIGNPSDWQTDTQQGLLYAAIVAQNAPGTLHAGRHCHVCHEAAKSLLSLAWDRGPLAFKSGGELMAPGKPRFARLANKVREVHAYMADPQPDPTGTPDVEPTPEPTPEPMPEPEPSEPSEPSGAPRHAVSDYVLTLVRANIPVWLHGPAGTGKSSAAKYAADELGLDYFEVNLAGAMRSAITGRDQLKRFVESDFTRAYTHGGLIAMEELDTAHPLVLTTINNAIAGDHFANDATGELIPRHPDFRIVATANTLGNGGSGGFSNRQKLDGATLDRFRIGRVFVGLDPKLERVVWDSIVAKYAPRRRELDRFWSEVERLRTFVGERLDGNGRPFDALDSMRVKFDGANAIGNGAPVDAVLSSITATWQDDTRAQARIASFDYAGFSA